VDDNRLVALGTYTPEGYLTPGYGDHYLFFVGRDDVHGILLWLLTRETMGLKFNMFGYDDAELNGAILALMASPNVAVQGTLDKSQAGGPAERAILASDLKDNPDFYNSFVITTSATHQISHTKGGVLIAQGLWFEGSANWSGSGEGTGIKLAAGTGLNAARDTPAPGFKAQNNTLLVSANPVGLTRFGARLDVEHRTGMQQQAARDAKAAAAKVTEGQ
jgi:hypothetical protein